MRITAAVTESTGAPFALQEPGRFPAERLMSFHDLDQIEQAARDAETGKTVESVLRMTNEGRTT